MITKNLKEQTWAYTNNRNSVSGLDYSRGYYDHQDNGSLDSPNYVASGSTVENIVHFDKYDRFGRTGEYDVERVVIGSISPRV